TDWWIGHGHDTGEGHTAVGAGGSKVLGHGIFCAALRGPVPRRMVRHHKCENTRCWYPGHLAPVTARAPRARPTAQRTACPHGPPYPENAYRDRSGSLRCKVCTKQRKAEAKRRAKADRRWRCTCGAEGGRDVFPLVTATTPQCVECGRKGGHHIKPCTATLIVESELAEAV